MRIGQAVVDCLDPGSAGVGEPGHLNRRRFAGEQQGTAVGHVHGQIDEDIDAVCANLLREAFVVEFKQHLSASYGRSIDNYAGEQIEVGDVREESNGDATVHTTIVAGDRDGARVDYRLRQRDGSWYVIDVIIEGVSLVRNFRVQIHEIVSSDGVDHLIETLREKNALEGETAPQD